MTAQTATMTRIRRIAFKTAPAVFVTPSGTMTLSEYMVAKRITARGQFSTFCGYRRINDATMFYESAWDQLWDQFARTVPVPFNVFVKGNVNGERERFHAFCLKRIGAGDGKLTEHTFQEWADLLSAFDTRDLRATQADALQ